jgi:hypothetical protein
MTCNRSYQSSEAGESSWWIPSRVEQPELLDLGYGSASDVSANLNEMWRANQYLGGFRALVRHLYPRLAASEGLALTLADLGTGSADIPVRIAHWARRHGLNLRIFALDWATRNLATAHRRIAGSTGIDLVQGDANALPLAPEGVDYVISSLFLHHLAPQDVIHLLRSALDCARRGIIMTDLTRGWLPLAAFRLAQPVLAHNFLTRHDGALSIRRAYTPAELRELAAAAGLPNARLYTHWAWRVTLVVDK